MTGTKVEFADSSEVASGAIADAIAYWTRIRAGAAMPPRSSIDPIEMRSFLSKILLIDVEPGGRYRYRLCGTQVRDLNLTDLKGRYADSSALGGAVHQFLETYHRTVNSKAPVFFHASMWWQDRGFVEFEQVNLPLSSDGITVDNLLCVIEVTRTSLQNEQYT